MKNVGRNLKKMLVKTSGKMLTKKCWNIYKMLIKNVGYTLKMLKKMLTSLKKC
jgi:hypothetical protein